MTRQQGACLAQTASIAAFRLAGSALIMRVLHQMPHVMAMAHWRQHTIVWGCLIIPCEVELLSELSPDSAAINTAFAIRSSRFYRMTYQAGIPVWLYIYRHAKKHRRGEQQITPLLRKGPACRSRTCGSEPLESAHTGSTCKLGSSIKQQQSQHRNMTQDLQPCATAACLELQAASFTCP